MKYQLCPKCDGRGVVITPPSVTQIHAPWTAEQVAELERHQKDRSIHPYTCACGDHVELVPTPLGWVCPKEGVVVQTWAWGLA
jgi:hypothetical protein